MVKMPHVNKKQYQEIELWFKLKNRPRTNFEWIGKKLLTNTNPKKGEKTAKNKVKLPHLNKKYH